MKEQKDTGQPTPAPQPIKARPAGPEAESWHEYRRKNRQEEPQRLEEAAKFLAGMISIALTIFLGMLDEKLLAGQLPAGGIAATLAAWVLSLILAFLVLFPRSYRFAAQSAEDIERMHQRVVRYKYWLLVFSVLLFLFAIIMLSAMFMWLIS